MEYEFIQEIIETSDNESRLKEYRTNSDFEIKIKIDLTKDKDLYFFERLVTLIEKTYDKVKW